MRAAHVLRQSAPAGSVEQGRCSELDMTASRRGHLRVFLGTAAGVGKTFRILLEGHDELEAGREVVIGLLETHGRAETATVAEGLPSIPRRWITCRVGRRAAGEFE